MARSIILFFVVLSVIAVVKPQLAQSAQPGQYAFSYTVNQHRLDGGVPSDFETTVNDQYTPEQTQHLLYNAQQAAQQPQQQYAGDAGQQYQAQQ